MPPENVSDAIVPPVLERGPLESPFDPLAQILFAGTAQLAPEPQVLGRGEQRIERHLLRNQPELAARRDGGGRAVQLLTQELDRAVIEPDPIDHRADQGGLAGTVRPQERKPLALVERE